MTPKEKKEQKLTLNLQRIEVFRSKILSCKTHSQGERST
jgi:hypothetical protein